MRQAGAERLRKIVAHLAQGGEAGAVDLGLRRGRRDAHEALNLQPREREERLELLAQRRGGKAELRGLAGDVHFEEDLGKEPQLGRHAVHRFRQRERVHAVEQLEERQRVAQFVPLEMPDEMPAGSSRQERDFCPRLLHAALAKERVPRVHRLADGIGRMGLGDRDQLDLRRITPRGPGGFREALLSRQRDSRRRCSSVGQRITSARPARNRQGAMESGAVGAPARSAAPWSAGASDSATPLSDGWAKAAGGWDSFTRSTRRPPSPGLPKAVSRCRLPPHSKAWRSAPSQERHQI